MNRYVLFLSALVVLGQMPCALADAVGGTSAREHWRLSAYLLPTPEHGQYTLELRSHPSDGFVYTLHRRQVRAQLCHLNGDPVFRGVIAALHPDTPDVIPVALDDHGLHIARVEIVLQTDGLPPAMYLLRAVAIPDATDKATGQAVTIPMAKASTRVFIPPKPDKRPEMASGQRFICMPSPEQRRKGPVYELVTGKPVTWERAYFRIFTLHSAGGDGRGHQQLAFHVDGISGDVRYNGALERGWPPGLTPVLDDAEVRRLRAKYVGRKVWGYGGLNAEVIALDPHSAGSTSLAVADPATVRSVVRLHLASQPMSIGPSEDESGYLSEDPVLVILDVPDTAEWTSMSWFGPRDEDALETPLADRALAYCWRFSGSWDMERAYSLSSPGSGEHWLRSVRRHILAGEITRGMTHEMVAWARGWPDEYGTAAEMGRLDTWRYDSAPPFNYWVYSRNGKVVDFGPDGTLP